MCLDRQQWISNDESSVVCDPRDPLHVGQYPDSTRKLETVKIILYKEIEVAKIIACRTGSRLEYYVLQTSLVFFYKGIS